MRGGACMIMWRMLMTVLLVVLPNAAQGQTAIAKSGSTSVSRMFEGKTANVTIHTVRIESSSGAFPSVEWGAKAVTLVQKLEISVDRKSLFIPRSVFADLLDPRLVSVEFEKGNFVLTVTGADGAESYFVRIYFDATQIKRRMLYSSLAPETLAEDTLYWLTVLKDE